MEGLLVLLGLAFVISPFVALAIAASANRRAAELEEKIKQLALTVRRLERSQFIAPPPKPEPGAAAEPVKPKADAAVEPIELAPLSPLSPPLPIGPTPEQRDRVKRYADSMRQMHQQAKAEGAEPQAESPTSSSTQPGAATAAASAPPLPPRKPVTLAPKRRAPISFEELLSTKVIVWIAAVAVALAGVFLVRYFVQRDLLEDWMKVSLATALGLGLIAGGEVARWRKLAMIAQGLVAAGIPILYAVILGCVQVYRFPWMPVGLAFVLLGVVTAAAVALSLRHGQLVALLGLIGGFLMPALIGANRQPPVQLFGYLFLLQVALIAVTRHRRWWWLTTAALVAGLVWAGAWIWPWFDPTHPGSQTWVGMFLLASVGAFIAGCWGADDDDLAGEFPVATLIGWIAVPVALILSAMLVKTAGFTNLDWAQLALMSAAALVLGRLRKQYLALPWIGAGVVAMLLVIWGADVSHAFGGARAVEAGGHLSGRFMLITAMFGALYAGGAYACLWGSPSSSTFARLSAISGVVFLAIAYWFVNPEVVAGPWWVWAVMLAALYGGLAMPIHARRPEMPGGDGALAAMAVAASSLVAIAVWWAVGEHQMQRPWVTVAWAIQMPAVAYIARRLRVADLFVFAGLLGVLIAARLLLNPNIGEYPIGDHPVFNWLLWGYGVPVIGYAATAWAVRGIADDIGARWCEAAAALVGFAMLTLMVRHGFHPDTKFEGPADLYELATYAAAWGAVGIGLAMAAGRWARPVLRVGAVAMIAAMIAVTLMGSTLALNPIFKPFDLGDSPIVNGMLYVYLLPAAIACGAAWVMRRSIGNGDSDADGERAAGSGFEGFAGVAMAIEWWGLALVFVWLTLEVRHGFFPQWGSGDVGLFEAATYSVAWGAAAITLWFAAARWRRNVLDAASTAALVASMVAVFVGPMALVNPLFTPAAVGDTPVFNWLLYLYGVPAAIALLSARLIHRRHGEKPLIASLGICGLVLLFALVTLEVRQAFVGPILAGAAPRDAEGYAYSAAWIVFASVLLAAALLIRTPIKAALRWSSLAVMLAAVAKVFLYDTRQLEDLWRVLSFLGLGASLFVVAWVYQRFVFAHRQPPITASPAASSE